VSRDLGQGTGKAVAPGEKVKIKTTGWVYDPRARGNKGTQYTKDDDPPRIFKIGSGDIMAGLDQGVIGMRVGGKRELIIPPEHAFGTQGLAPNVPPNAIVMVHVTLEGIE
jgi:FKBP-type peptidyl-prolyl cis-trans isomerase FkpA